MPQALTPEVTPENQEHVLGKYQVVDANSKAAATAETDAVKKPGISHQNSVDMEDLVTAYLRGHGRNRLNDLLAQALAKDEAASDEAASDAARAQAENKSQGSSSVLRNFGVDISSLRIGLEDIQALNNLSRQSADYKSGCSCRSCQADRRFWESADEQTLFEMVNESRSNYVRALEQSVRRFGQKNGTDSEDEDSTSRTDVVLREETSSQRIVSKISRMIQYEDEDGDILNTLPETEKPKGRSERRKKTYAIEVTRPMRRSGVEGLYSYSPAPGGLMKLTINSPPIIEALRKTARFHPPGLLENSSLQVWEPFGFVVQHMDKIEMPETTSEGPSVLENHLHLLKTVIHEKYGDDIKAEKDLWQQSPSRCTFEMLWLLFEKGEDVYAKVGGEYRAFVVSDITSPGRQVKGKQPTFAVDCWYMDFDGKEFGRVQHPEDSKFTIFPFQGTKDITSLPVYPAKYHINKAGETPLDKDLIERGKKLWNLRTKTQRMYKGETLDYGKRYIENKVMVDYQTYVRLNPDKIVLGEIVIVESRLVSKPINGCNCLECLGSKEYGSRITSSIFEKYDRISADSEILTDHQLMLLTNRVPGYYFQDRKWVQLNSTHLSEYQPRKEGFKQLVLPPGHAELIEALIKTRYLPGQDNSRRETFTADVVRGKGKGLIILLHGAPGVGKTSTAECVAELTGLPLFPITCGDIGTTATDVEDKLKDHFELAQLWNAVLLLDEADVFLQARDVDSSSLIRNSLVSVFLRVLEYYDGILFLTTNRIGDFDEAFKSRIHVILHYPKLENEAVTRIWKNLIDNLEMNHPSITVSESAQEYLVESKEIWKTQWNGRQIRNSFQTAVALAEFEQDPDGIKKKFTVSAKHFKQVVQLSQKFEAYMNDVKHGTDSELAYYHGIRKDDTGGRRKKKKERTSDAED